MPSEQPPARPSPGRPCHLPTSGEHGHRRSLLDPKRVGPWGPQSPTGNREGGGTCDSGASGGTGRLFPEL